MPRVVQQPTKALPSGPWILVNDALDASLANPQTLFDALNMYPDPQLGAWINRPGTQVQGDNGDGEQLGVSGHRRVQGSGQWTKRNSDGSVTRYTVDVCGGKFYTYDWGTDTFTEVQTAADFAAKGITLDQDSRVYFSVCGTQTGFSQLHVSDGINTPFLWDGSTGGGTGAGLTKLTNSPALYGQPIVYYAKIMGIVAGNRGQVMWGEENDPTVGYDMAQYNNVFQDPGAQDANPLYGILGTNEAVIVYRERSTTSISGKLDTQFQATGVRQDVSNAVGIESSASVVFHEGTIFSLDADGKPRYQVGLSVNDSVWRECRQTIGTLNLGALGAVQAADYTPANVIVFGVPETSNSDMTMLMVISITSGEPHFVGTWTGPWGTFSTLAMAQDDEGVPVLRLGTTDGYIYRFGDPDRVGSTSIVDDIGPGGIITPMTHRVTPSDIGGSTNTEYQFTRADVLFRVQSDMTVQASYQTPRSQSSLLSATIRGSGTRYGEADYGTFTYGGGVYELHKAFGYGRNGNGRWIRPTFTHVGAGEQFGILSMTVDSLPVSRQARTP